MLWDSPSYHTSPALPHLHTGNSYPHASASVLFLFSASSALILHFSPSLHLPLQMLSKKEKITTQSHLQTPGIPVNSGLLFA